MGRNDCLIIGLGPSCSDGGVLCPFPAEHICHCYSPRQKIQRSRDPVGRNCCSTWSQGWPGHGLLCLYKSPLTGWCWRSILALSSYSLWQAICTKLGFTKKAEVLYKDFSIDGKNVFEENKIQYLQKSAISYYKILSI